MKAKPVKGSARVKKFDVGGTVGALAGLGTLAYLLSRKKKGADAPDAAKTMTARSAMGEDVTGEDEGKKRAMAASKGRPEMGDVTPEMKSDEGATRAGTKPAPKVTPKPRLTPKATVTPSATNAKTAPAKDKTPATASKTTPNIGKSNEERPSKPYPTEQAEANKVKNTPGVTVMKPSDKEIKGIKAKQDAAARAKKGQGMTPYASSGREEIMRKNRFHKEAELGRGIKKGGVIKKYADGGMTTSKPMPKKPLPPELQREKENQDKDRRVRKEQETYEKGEKTRIKEQGSMFKNGGMTASKRGDGCAMRGKTKGKMY